MDRQALNLELAAIARECPRWHVWVGAMDLLYGRRALTSPPRIVRAETSAELLDKILQDEEDHARPI